MKCNSMTALQKALENNPKMEADRIIHYGCPDRYGVGEQPSWCQRPKVMLVDQCAGCWNQKGEVK